MPATSARSSTRPAAGQAARAAGFFGFRTGPSRLAALEDPDAVSLPRLDARTFATGPFAPPDPALLAGRAERVGGKAEGLSPEERLIQRATMGATVVDRDQVERMGYFPYRDRLIAENGLDDKPLEDLLTNAYPALEMSPIEIVLSYGDEQEQPILQLLAATFYRSVYSPRQLYERMMVFWQDHFNIDILSDYGAYLFPTHLRTVLRPHALGTFPELLRATARSPAMLDYLTNDSNRKGHPNENYARELMELHTMGVDGGYTQEDVREVARCFTGWSWRSGRDAGLRWGQFVFNRREHDDGAKVVLGHAIPAGGGIQDGERVLEILANHPATARFLATKMLRYFWGYEPTERMVGQLAASYTESGGDIRTMLKTVLRRRWMATATSKLKRPYHAVVSSLRATFASVSQPFYPLREVQVAGHLPFFWAPPNGYPDSRGYWTGFLMPRWNYAFTVPLADDIGVTMPLDDYLDPRLTPIRIVRRLDALLFDGRMRPETSNALRGFLRAAPREPARMRQVLGLALAAPELLDY